MCSEESDKPGTHRKKNRALIKLIEQPQLSGTCRNKLLFSPVLYPCVHTVSLVVKKNGNEDYHPSSAQLEKQDLQSSHKQQSIACKETSPPLFKTQALTASHLDSSAKIMLPGDKLSSHLLDLHWNRLLRCSQETPQSRALRGCKITSQGNE